VPENAVSLGIACGLALAWLPVFLRFVRAWRARSNPISLAICALIFFAIYIPVYIAGMFPPSWPTATVLTIDALSCALFYVTFRYADRKFPDTRKNGA